LQTVQDHNVFARKHVYSVLLGFHDSIVSDAATRYAALRVIERASTLRSHPVTKAADDAADGDGTGGAAAGDEVAEDYIEHHDEQWYDGGRRRYRRAGEEEEEEGGGGGVEWEDADAAGGYDGWGHGGDGDGGTAADAAPQLTLPPEGVEVNDGPGPNAPNPTGALHLWKRVAALTWLSSCWQRRSTKSLTGASTADNVDTVAFLSALHVFKAVAAALLTSTAAAVADAGAVATRRGVARDGGEADGDAGDADGDGDGGDGVPAAVAPAEASEMTLDAAAVPAVLSALLSLSRALTTHADAISSGTAGAGAATSVAAGAGTGTGAGAGSGAVGVGVGAGAGVGSPDAMVDDAVDDAAASAPAGESVDAVKAGDEDDEDDEDDDMAGVAVGAAGANVKVPRFLRSVGASDDPRAAAVAAGASAFLHVCELLLRRVSSEASAAAAALSQAKRRRVGSAPPVSLLLLQQVASPLLLQLLLAIVDAVQRTHRQCPPGLAAALARCLALRGDVLQAVDELGVAAGGDGAGVHATVPTDGDAAAATDGPGDARAASIQELATTAVAWLRGEGVGGHDTRLLRWLYREARSGGSASHNVMVSTHCVCVVCCTAVHNRHVPCVCFAGTVDCTVATDAVHSDGRCAVAPVAVVPASWRRRRR
jgi:hypothetical protein